MATVEDLPEDPSLPAIAFAAPGSGKTRRIVGLACRLLERGQPGNRLVLLTFTREAGHQLQVRLLQRTLGTPLEAEAKAVFAGTVDSYALELLHRHDPRMRNWALIGNPAAIVRLLHARRQIDLWSLFPSPIGRQWEGTGAKVSRFLEHVQYVYNEDRDLNHMRRSNAALASAIEAYWTELDRRRHLDFGTCVRALNALLAQNGEALAAENGKTFLVDEGQDLNTNQLLLTERLAGPAKRLLVVGDDDQQMYSWRGSDPVNLQRAMARMGAKPYTLGTNFRSTEEIIAPARRLIQQNAHRFSKQIRGRGRHGNPSDVAYHKFDDVGKEIDATARIVRNTVGKSYRRPGDEGEREAKPHTIAYRDVLILVRSRSEPALRLITHLRASGTPVDATNVLNVEKHSFGKLVINCLRYIVYEGRDDRTGLATTRTMAGLLGNEFGFGSAPIARFLAFLETFKVTYWAESQRRNGKPWAFAQKVFHAFVQGVLRAGWPGTFDDEMELILGVLSTATRDYEEVTPRIGGRGLRWLVEMFHEKDGLPTKSPGTQAPDAVRIFTVHNAKGLEADLVVLPFATEKQYPMLFARDPVKWQWDRTLDRPYAEGIDQERNLFYVAITRSRRFLHVTFSEAPSPFISEAGMRSADLPSHNGQTTISPTGAILGELVTTMSDLRLARGCGYRYRLAKVFGYKPGASTQIGYGNSIHLINQLNLDNFRDHGVPMERTRYEGEIPLLTHLPYAWGGTLDDLKAGVSRLSLRLWDKWEREPPRVLDTEIGFTIPLSNVTIIEGRTDILAQLDGNSALWNIDLKTRNYAAKQASLSNSELAWDITTQQIYHIGLQDVVKSEFGRGLERSQLYFGRPNVHLEVPTRSTDLRRAAETVEELADNIQRGHLKAQPGPQCATCDFKLVCRFAPTNTLAEDVEVAPLLSVSA